MIDPAHRRNPRRPPTRHPRPRRQVVPWPPRSRGAMGGGGPACGARAGAPECRLTDLATRPDARGRRTSRRRHPLPVACTLLEPLRNQQHPSRPSVASESRALQGRVWPPGAHRTSTRLPSATSGGMARDPAGGETGWPPPRKGTRPAVGFSRGACGSRVHLGESSAGRTWGCGCWQPSGYFTALRLPLPAPRRLPAISALGWGGWSRSLGGCRTHGSRPPRT